MLGKNLLNEGVNGQIHNTEDCSQLSIFTKNGLGDLDNVKKLPDTEMCFWRILKFIFRKDVKIRFFPDQNAMNLIHSDLQNKGLINFIPHPFEVIIHS